ncbi:hypothetical protein PVAND_000579 [Polypedilum vanderplanki]|uniref:HAT C-terminal dimerisation domain-containing protein n=1 Tax=Polypedilum vanderplanki TaxID=319348 RepID=A0A9J6BL04_POLVA|nr:hypothetical protein PVAND_000579 [Polypedilum vanderplanki]
MKSFAWKYFKKIDDKYAECQVQNCTKKRIAITGSNTKGMIGHLKNIHNILKDELNNSDAQPPQKKQKTIMDFVKFSSLKETIARLVCEDNMNFKQIVKSEYMRKSLQRDFSENVPKNSSTIMKLFLEFYEDIRQQTIILINDLRGRGLRFSVTLDEWTSGANKRYLNINLHYFERENAHHINLGMIRMDGSWTANRLKQQFDEHMKSFNIDVCRDVIAATGDGASVMVAFGKLNSFLYHECLSHGLHLGVNDALYNSSMDFNIAAHNFISECLTEDSSEESEECDSEESTSDITDDENLHFTSAEDFYNGQSNIIKKMYQVIKVFRNSPLKNGILQKLIKRKLNKELNLILDTPTRWNSVFDAACRFLVVEDCVRSSLCNKDINRPDMWTCLDTELLKELVKVLEPVKMATEQLSDQNNNLLIAEGIVNFLLNSLRDSDSSFSSLFYDTIHRRIAKRRNGILVQLMLYLRGAKLSNTYEHFEKHSKTSVLAYGTNLLKNHFSNTDRDYAETSNHESTSEESTSHLSLRERLNRSIFEYTSVPQAVERPAFDEFFTEFQKLDHGKTSEVLEQLSNSLLTIQPTSVQSERIFSMSNNILSKNRRRMLDKTLNAIVFVKSYFLNK